MKDPAIAARTRRTQWFRESRFGMFIHWGLYAIPARGEWVRSVERMPEADYLPFFHEFTARDCDPRAWAKLAKEAGMKYAVLTAKHHDGFCLWDSRLTDFKSTNTPAGRDFVREFLEAFRAEGLKVGLYYSLLDWHHPDFYAYGDRQHPERDNEAFKDHPHDFDRYLRYLHGQVEELLTDYGKLDLLWFDFSYEDAMHRMSGETWRATELMGLVRRLQPDIVVNNRLESGGNVGGTIAAAHPAVYAGDFASPEQMLPPDGIRDPDGDPVPWEACITLNDHWGYVAHDHHYKTAAMVVRMLAECAAKNGNLILNVGPDARGRIPAEAQAVLREVGAWMEKNGDAVYGCGACALAKPEWGRYTQRGNKIYAHVLEPSAGAFPVQGLSGRIVKARLLADGSQVSLTTPWNAEAYPDYEFFSFDGQGYPLPDEKDTVVEFTIKE